MLSDEAPDLTSKFRNHVHFTYLIILLTSSLNNLVLFIEVSAFDLTNTTLLL